MTSVEQRLLLKGLSKTAEATKRRLHPKESNCFVNLYNDWLDLWGTIGDCYPKAELLTSMVYADLLSLGKELHWMHRLFLWGNYATVHRNLRHVWELMYLAHFADTVEIRVPEINDLPGRSIDAKAAWLDKHCLAIRWKTVIKPLLAKVVQKGERQYYSKIWGSLNRTVHVSLQLRHSLVEESALAVKDAFDPKWAKDTCRVASDVFDVIWLIVLRRFPDCITSLETQDSFRNTPRCRKLIEN